MVSFPFIGTQWSLLVSYDVLLSFFTRHLGFKSHSFFFLGHLAPEWNLRWMAQIKLQLLYVLHAPGDNALPIAKWTPV